MARRGNNEFVGGASPTRLTFKTRTTAEVEAAAAAEELRLIGTEKLRAAMKPGGLFRFTTDVVSEGALDGFERIVKAPRAVPVDHPRSLRKGMLLLLAKSERISLKEGGLIKKLACYTFLIMGVTRRAALTDLTLIEHLASLPTGDPRER